MTDFEKELIHYIFHVQDADDDNLSAEVICRKLYKYGLIDRGGGCWRPKKRLRYRWPARAIRKAEQTEPQKKMCANCKHIKKHNGKLADYVCDRKGSIVTNPYDKECDEMWEQTEPNSSEIPNNCEDEPQIFICPIQDNYEALIEDEPQTDCGWK